MHDYTNEQLSAANPSVLAAQNGDLKTVIDVLRKLASDCQTEWAAENLETSADIIEKEVKQ